jgi:predicted acylesterase/phospholipase RssA
MLISHEISLYYYMLGLVLGGGAAKGYAHIGVLKVLEEENITPDIIVGASMGALVGGLYAAGYTGDELVRLASAINIKKKRWLFPLRFSKKGFIAGKRIMQYLTQYIGDKKIEDLRVKYATVATDIEHGKEIIISRGSLLNAIRAAISIPVVFIPHYYAGHLLIDGGFVNPVPVDIAFRLGAKKIIAVNVLRKIEYTQSELIESKNPQIKYNIKKIFLEYVDCATSRLIDYQIKQLKNGLMIHVNTRGIGLSQFEKGAEAVKRGYNEAAKYRKQLRRFK